MLDNTFIQSDETSLAKKFAGDPGVRISATGRVCPNRCDLCTAFHEPQDKALEWPIGVMPERTASPALAREVLKRWEKELPEEVVASLASGFIPWKALHAASKRLEMAQEDPESDHTQAIMNAEFVYKGEVENIRARKDPDEGQKAKEESAAAMRKSQEIAQAHSAYEKAKSGVNPCADALADALDHFGECRKAAGRATPFSKVDSHYELRHRILGWCDSGELRADVAPDPNRDMTPNLPPKARKADTKHN